MVSSDPAAGFQIANRTRGVTLNTVSNEFQTKVTDNTLHIFINVPRLDASAASAIKQQLHFEISPEVRQAEIDLSSVQFVDSSGIGVLLSIYRKLPSPDSEVILHNVHSGVQAVIELLRLHRIFKVA